LKLPPGLDERLLDHDELKGVGHSRSSYLAAAARARQDRPAMETELQSFEDFWPHYVHAHRNPVNRALHYTGTTLALGSVAAAVTTFNPLWLLAAPVAGYGPAWIGHFFFEKNKPATFEHPLWSLRGDFKMYWLGLRGRMGAELERVCGGELAPEHTDEDHLAGGTNGAREPATA
jgi:hypothetical protein